MTNARLARLTFPALVMVTAGTGRTPNVEATGEVWLDDIVRDAVLGGVSVVQLREKHLERGDLIALGLHVRDAIAERALFFVNGDVEAALALAADGVHLAEDGESIGPVRDRIGEDMLISRAVHSVEAAVRAERAGADMVQAGTVFATASKPGRSPIAVDGLRAICEAVDVPVIAIGGITAVNAGEALAAGAKGVAVISAIADAPSPRDAAVALRRAIDESKMSGAA